MQTSNSTFPRLLARFQGCEDGDCVVKCRGAEFKVHRSTLREHSPILDAYIACCDKKDEKVVLELHNFSVQTVQALLEFMYCANYSLGRDTIKDLEPECGSGPEVMGTGAYWDAVTAIGQKNLLAACKFHIRVGIAARYYQMNSLDDLSGRKFESSLSGVQVDGLAVVVQNADRLIVDVETQRMVAGAVAGAIQKEDNKHHLENLKMTKGFRGLVAEHLECWRKADEAVLKRLREPRSASERRQYRYEHRHSLDR
ncbi:unnamed protein product [Clonostachys solani]|uniref:BTB domain-containing protein n=1 Tax=Clonostachys solani TaxID=160281 RepID=A0A9N9Z1E7_9HYPO|nr:unnamed protein product [Clonostachys solani]